MNENYKNTIYIIILGFLAVVELKVVPHSSSWVYNKAEKTNAGKLCTVFFYYTYALRVEASNYSIYLLLVHTTQKTHKHTPHQLSFKVEPFNLSFNWLHVRSLIRGFKLDVSSGNLWQFLCLVKPH